MRAGGSIRGSVATLAACAGLAAAAPAQAALSFQPAYTDSVAKPVDTPIFVTAPPGDSARLFVVERGGRIRLAVHGQMLDTPFLDISSKVQTSGEGGLLSLAFPDDYATSGKFYLYYVEKADPGAS